MNNWDAILQAEDPSLLEAGAERYRAYWARPRQRRGLLAIIIAATAAAVCVALAWHDQAPPVVAAPDAAEVSQLESTRRSLAETRRTLHTLSEQEQTGPSDAAALTAAKAAALAELHRLESVESRLVQKAAPAPQRLAEPRRAVFTVPGRGFFVYAAGIMAVVSGCVGAQILLSVRLRPPRALQSPAGTARDYYTALLVGHLPSRYDSFVLLLESAKKQATSPERFASYWNDVRRTMIRYASEVIRSRNDHPITFSFRVCVIETANLEPRIAVCRVEVVVKLTKHRRSRHPVVLGGGTTPEEVGRVALLEECILAEVGSRWYVTSPWWTGRRAINGVAGEFVRPDGVAAEAGPQFAQSTGAGEGTEGGGS